MRMSLYPTDALSVREEIIAQADILQVTQFFVSLHIPEAQNLREFITWLQDLHQNQGYTFFADISPLTLQQLDIKLTELQQLQQYGVIGVRIDFGFSLAEIKQIAATGIQVAINASTVTEMDVQQLAPLGVIGWHNYYPRPDTGISEAYFVNQNQLLRKYNIPIYTFIPGDVYCRAPLHLQLPMLECQRGVDAYVNYLLQIKKYHVDEIYLAEGILASDALQYIKTYDEKQVITIPTQWLREDVEKALHGNIWYIRIEETDMSWRIEETRALVEDVQVHSSETTCRTVGSIYMDTEAYGRYAGELHLIHTQAASDAKCNYVGEISQEYLGLLTILQERPMIIFERKRSA